MGIGYSYFVGSIQGRKSTSEFNRNEYRKSWRAQRRRQFVAVRAQIRAAKPPPLFGPNTDILVVLASSAPIRLVALQELFGEQRASSFSSKDAAGICRDWDLKTRTSRGQRGRAIALDPAFPFYKEVMAVLEALGLGFPFTATQDLTKAEAVSVPMEGRAYDFEALVSDNRRLVLTTLEALGGRARVSELFQAVPEMREAVGDDEIRRLVRDKILAKTGKEVHFVDAPWAPPFRALLRAYLDSKPDLMAAIEATAEHKRAFRPHGTKMGFLGRLPLQRAMLTLAAHGPLTTVELERMATVREVRLTLGKLINSGIVARVFVEPQPHERNGHYVLGFNAAHPVYEQVVNLCSAIAGEPRSTKPPLSIDLEEYALDGLLMTDLRLNVLTSVATGIHGEIDPATVFRWFTEHDRGLLERRLQEWAEEGLLIRRGDAPQTFYRFNPKHPYVPALLTLFRRIAEVWPDYGNLPALEPRLYPEKRVARERNRPRPIVRE